MTEADLIAAHIREHGVTRCPAAIVAPTSAELPEQDLAAHRERAVSQPPVRLPWQPAAENRRGNRR